MVYLQDCNIVNTLRIKCKRMVFFQLYLSLKCFTFSLTKFDLGWRSHHSSSPLDQSLDALGKDARFAMYAPCSCKQSMRWPAGFADAYIDRCFAVAAERINCLIPMKTVDTKQRLMLLPTWRSASHWRRQAGNDARMRVYCWDSKKECIRFRKKNLYFAHQIRSIRIAQLFAVYDEKWVRLTQFEYVHKSWNRISKPCDTIQAD